MKSSTAGNTGDVALPQAPTRPSWFSDRARARINLLLRLIVGGVFVFAGALKIADPAKFAVDVANYRLAPRELLNLVAIIVPAVEVMAGLFLLAGVWARAAALVIIGLTVMFLVVIISALARGLNIECGCFGTVGGHHVGMVSLAIDGTLLLLAVFLAATSRSVPLNPPSLSPITPDSAPRAGSTRL